MDPRVIRLLIAGALFVHGVGHTLGFFMPTESKMFPNLSEQSARIFSSVIWLLSTIGFLLALLGFLAGCGSNRVVAEYCRRYCFSIPTWTGSFWP